MLQHDAGRLLSTEREEIRRYETVYYYGQHAEKRYDTTQPNNGFDDAAGDYNPVARDHIAYRYELLQLLGAGSFGRVYRAFDHKHHKMIAIKVLKNRRKFRRQGIVEIRLLEALRDAGHARAYHCLVILGRGDFRNHLYIVMDLLQCDLYAYLARGGLRGLPAPDVKIIASQCICALAYWQGLNIIHADVKPENILLEREGSLNIQVIDFGSGAFVGKTLYQYIQSRYYRAPEVILGFEYSYPIDTWSMGCVFYELATGHPIFQGENEADQLGKICEILGYPDPTFIRTAPRCDEFFWEVGNNAYRLRTNHKVGSRRLGVELHAADPGLVELIERMLVWEGAGRISARDAMRLRYFADINWGNRNSDTQPPCMLPDIK